MKLVLTKCVATTVCISPAATSHLVCLQFAHTLTHHRGLQSEFIAEAARQERARGLPSGVPSGLSLLQDKVRRCCLPSLVWFKAVTKMSLSPRMILLLIWGPAQWMNQMDFGASLTANREAKDLSVPRPAASALWRTLISRGEKCSKLYLSSPSSLRKHRSHTNHGEGVSETADLTVLEPTMVCDKYPTMAEVQGS